MVLDPSHRKWPGESREVADRIDDSDARRGSSAGQECGGQRPEHRETCENAEARNAKRDHLQQGIIERGGDSDADRRKEQRKGGMEPALGDAIRAPAPPYHADGADNVGGGGTRVVRKMLRPNAFTICGRKKPSP